MLSKKIGMLFTFLDSALLPQLLNGLYGEGGDGMSILIKGMEMPKRCIDCPFMVSRDNDDCILQTEVENELARTWEELKASCPLTELPPHGRLIDIKSVEYGKFTTVGNEYQRWWNGALESVIDNAPTVIEAEGETE